MKNVEIKLLKIIEEMQLQQHHISRAEFYSLALIGVYMTLPDGPLRDVLELGHKTAAAAHVRETLTNSTNRKMDKYMNEMYRLLKSSRFPGQPPSNAAKINEFLHRFEKEFDIVQEGIEP